MTSGERISLKIIEDNAGGVQVDDAPTRYRNGAALQWAGDTGYNFRPYNRRLMSDTVDVEDGVGSLPSTYATRGSRMVVTLEDSPNAPLIYIDEGEYFRRLRQTPNNRSQQPRFWTLRGVSIEGRTLIHTLPINNTVLTLNLDNYVSKSPVFVDRPDEVTLTEGSAGDLDGVYGYAVAFVTTDGETEPGKVVYITVANKRVNLSDIQIPSEAYPITGQSIITGRKVYRTAAGGAQLKLLATLADILTTDFEDNEGDDGALGANAPTVLTAVTGLERFPINHHVTTIGDLMELRLARKSGDGRSGGELSQAAIRTLQDMWADENTPVTPGRAPRYGARHIARRNW